MYKTIIFLILTISMDANYIEPVEPIIPVLPTEHINIRLSPSYAKISIIDDNMVHDDITFLKEGNYRIKITADGYKEKIMNISVPHSNFPLILEREEATYTYKKMIERNDIVYENHPFRKKYTWNEAQGYCTNLTLGSYKDWRLPTREELRIIMNMETYQTYDDGLDFGHWFEENYKSLKKNNRGHSYFIDPEFIEEMPPFYPWFWTSEKKSLINDIFYKNKPDNFFWIVTFDYSYDAWSNKPNFVRCVRKKIKL